MLGFFYARILLFLIHGVEEIQMEEEKTSRMKCLSK